jgi:hypothetical protein
LSRIFHKGQTWISASALPRAKANWVLPQDELENAWFNLAIMTGTLNPWAHDLPSCFKVSTLRYVFKEGAIFVYKSEWIMLTESLWSHSCTITLLFKLQYLYIPHLTNKKKIYVQYTRTEVICWESSMQECSCCYPASHHINKTKVTY